MLVSTPGRSRIATDAAEELRAVTGTQMLVRFDTILCSVNPTG